MRIFKSIEEINRLINSPKSLVIGNFDGVHVAHVNLLQSFLQTSKSLDLTPILLTLNPHPHIYFAGEKCGTLLGSRDNKIQKLTEVGIENILEIDFTPEIQSMEAREFISNFLLKLSDLKHITLGHDFALGNGKEDSREILYEEASSEIQISEMDTFTVNDTTCSSTKIREELRAGEIEVANQLLGRPFLLEGYVQKGSGNGSAHLVPTANIQVDSTLVIPASGVYFTNTIFNNTSYKSITNIGTNPTINTGLAKTIESHLLDFDADLYDKSIKIEFLKKCRDEQRFNSIVELKQEILKNIEQRQRFDA